MMKSLIYFRGALGTCQLEPDAPTPRLLPRLVNHATPYLIALDRYHLVAYHLLSLPCALRATYSFGIGFRSIWF